MSEKTKITSLRSLDFSSVSVARPRRISSSGGAASRTYEQTAQLLPPMTSAFAGNRPLPKLRAAASFFSAGTKKAEKDLIGYGIPGNCRAGVELRIRAV